MTLGEGKDFIDPEFRFCNKPPEKFFSLVPCPTPQRTYGKRSKLFLLVRNISFKNAFTSIFYFVFPETASPKLIAAFVHELSTMQFFYYFLRQEAEFFIFRLSPNIQTVIFCINQLFVEIPSVSTKIKGLASTIKSNSHRRSTALARWASHNTSALT
jgi:hypothetical protein